MIANLFNCPKLQFSRKDVMMRHYRKKTRNHPSISTEHTCVSAAAVTGGEHTTITAVAAVVVVAVDKHAINYHMFPVNLTTRFIYVIETNRYNMNPTYLQII